MGKLISPRKRLIFGLAGGTLLVLGIALGTGITAMVNAHGGDPGKVHACRSSRGQVRLVGFNNDCSTLPGAWVPIDLDDDWSGAGTGSMFPSNLTDKIGIGTTSPTTMLQVNGHLTLSSDIASSPRIFGIGGQGNLVLSTSGSVDVWDGTNAKLFRIYDGVTSSVFLHANGTSYLNGGNVGIGTTSPESALQVSGYTQLDLTSGAPPAPDCDEASEHGRMKVDATAGVSLLYICTADEWVSK